MAIDPNEPTSDVGMMYRQFLQSKGMPLTQENMQRVIAQSQREPGMIAGLSVQSPDVSAPAPPNVAGASSSSSGALPIPPMPPSTGIPPSQPPSMAASGAHSPTDQPQSGAPQSHVNVGQGGGASVAPEVEQTLRQQTTPPQPNNNTPPPGQAPSPQQDGVPQSGSVVDSLLAGLGISGASIYALKKALGGPRSSVAPIPSAPPPMQGPPTGPLPMQGPPELYGPPTDTSPIGNILYDKPIGPQVAQPNTGGYGEGAQAMPWRGEAAEPMPAVRAPVGSASNYPGAQMKAPVRAPRVRGVRVP